MTIYTKNGKPILKNVSGVYKLVTGECCCEALKCGLPHVVLDVMRPSSPTEYGFDLTAAFKCLGTQKSSVFYSFGNHTTGEILADPTPEQCASGSYVPQWQTDPYNPPVTWRVPCSSPAAGTRTAELSVPDVVNLYEYGIFSINVGGYAFKDTPEWSLRCNVFVRKSFRAKVEILDSNGQYIPFASGSTITFSEENGSAYFRISQQ